MRTFLMFLWIVCIGCGSARIHFSISEPTDDAAEDEDSTYTSAAYALGREMDAGSPDVSTVDAKADVMKADASDAGSMPDVVVVPDAAPDVPQGGSLCPIQVGNQFPTSCGGGNGFRVHKVDGGVDYPCGQIMPACPSGWICWATDGQTVKQGLCP